MGGSKLQTHIRKVSSFRNASFRRTCFVGRLGDNGEGVQAGLKLVGEEVIDETVSFHEAMTLELRRNDLHVEVGLLVGTSPHGGVTRVLVRHVVHLQNGGFQRRLQLRSYPVCSG